MRIKLALLLVLFFSGAIASNASPSTPLTVTLDGGYPIQNPSYLPGYDEFLYSLNTGTGDYLTYGNTFTLSGISGLYNAIAPTNFTVSGISLSAGTVTFEYTGATTGTSFSEDGFELNSNPGYTFTAPGTFSATVTGSSPSVTGAVQVPSSVSATPEPSSLMLLGTGILGAAGFVRRKLEGK